MDRRTQSVLGRISAGVPRHLANNLIKKEVDTSEEELARAALRSPNISQSKKRRIASLLDKGRFRRTEEVVNEATVRAIDEHNTREIAKARRSGVLADPIKDPFYRARMERIARGGAKRSEPLSKEEIENARRALRPQSK